MFQFDSNDYKLIEEGKQKVSWWGTVEPVLIGSAEESITASATSALADAVSFLGGASTSTAPSTTSTSSSTPSAEVSISRDAGAKPASGTNRQSSLQF